jgi:uncharacterized protein (TIGR03067 family)
MKIQLLWVTVVLSYAAAPCSLRAGTDPDAIYGTWVAVAGEAFGHKMPEGEAGGMRITFTAKKAIWQFWTAEGNKSYEGFCRINASAIPNEIDLGQPDNPRPKSLGLGIYKIEDDKLTIWMTLMERPKDFSDVAAAKLELRREKSASGGVTDDPVAAKELTKLQGTWYHVSRVVDGKEVEGEDKEALLIVRRNR